MDVSIGAKSALQINSKNLRLMATRMRFCFDFLDYVYIIASYHLKMKFIVNVGETSVVPLHRAITSYIEIHTCIEHYATRAIYTARNYVLLEPSVWTRTRGRLPGSSPVSITRYYISTLIAMFVIKRHRRCARRKSEPEEIKRNLHRLGLNILRIRIRSIREPIALVHFRKSIDGSLKRKPCTQWRKICIRQIFSDIFDAWH